MPLPPLRLSDDRRYLTGGGEPFFFLADTAWSIVWKGQPDQWATYLDRRRAQGYSVLQVNLLPWRLTLADVEGNQPFHGGDVERPNEAYFARFDAFLAMAAERGLYTCLMLLWGGPRPHLPAASFTTDQAVAFARRAVERFTGHPMLWSLSGDAPYVEELAKWEAIGAAVEAADPNGHPTTNHLPPAMNWRFLHHRSAWHDFHMLQTGHRRRAIGDLAALPAAYHRLGPVKAVVNGEPWYENHPSRDDRHVYGPAFTPFDARYAMWVSVLSGATMGHTYGAQGIWNWKRAGDDETELAGPQIGPPWSEALEYDGAAQCGLAAGVLRALPWWRLEPAPERVALDPAPRDRLDDPYRAYAGVDLRPACAWIPDELLVAYAPAAEGRIVVRGLEPGDWAANWVDPRSGRASAIGPAAPAETGLWVAPPAPSGDDWALIVRRG